MKHFKIVIDVAYDDAHPIPDDMHELLHENVVHAIEDGLLDDPEMETVVDTYDLKVEILG